MSKILGNSKLLTTKESCLMCHVLCLSLGTLKKLSKQNFFYWNFIPERNCYFLLLLSSQTGWLGWWSLFRVLTLLPTCDLTLQEMQELHSLCVQQQCHCSSVLSAPPPPPDFLHWILSLYFLIFLSLRPVSMPVNWAEQFSSIKAELLWRCWYFRQISAAEITDIPILINKQPHHKGLKAPAPL